MADRTTTITLSIRDAFSGAANAFVSAMTKAESMAHKLGQKIGTTNDLMRGLGVNLPTNPMMALGEAIKFSVDAAKESEDVFAQTVAGVKSTGGAAGYTAKQLADLAHSFQDTTTYSDETILSAENLLITFDKIRGPIVKDATQAILDLSTRMGGDLQGAAIQVGKALQDPAVGLTALRRVGVSFNEEQIKVIKNLFDTGKVADAQRLILAELAKEFGGSATAAAKTFGGQIKQTQNQIDDLGEEIGGFIIGALGKLAGAFQTVKETWGSAGKIGDAFTGTVDKMRESVLAGDMTLEDYNKAVVDMAGVIAQGNTEIQIQIAKTSVLTQEQLDNGIMTQRLTDELKDENKWHKTTAAAADTQSKSLDGLSNSADSLSSATNLLRVGTQELTKEFIFNTAAQGLDADAALDLGLSMGVLNSDTVNTAKAVQALKDKYDINRDGAISASEATAGYAAEVRNLANGINSLHDKTVTVTVIHDEKIGGTSPLPGGAATGADFTVPPGYTRDSYPMRVQSGEHVTVTPANQVSKDGGGGKAGSKVTINIHTSQPITPQNLALIRAQAGAF